MPKPQVPTEDNAGIGLIAFSKRVSLAPVAARESWSAGAVKDQPPEPVADDEDDHSERDAAAEGE
jgi:hypothetical protein